MWTPRASRDSFFQNHAEFDSDPQLVSLPFSHQRTQKWTDRRNGPPTMSTVTSESTCFGDWSHPGNQRVCVNLIIVELSRSLAEFWIWWLYWMRILKALSIFVPVMCRIPTAYNLSWVISYCAQHWSFQTDGLYRWIPLKHPCLNNVSRAWKV